MFLGAPPSPQEIATTEESTFSLIHVHLLAALHMSLLYYTSLITI